MIFFLLPPAGFDAALVGHMGPLSPPDMKPDLKPDISLLNGGVGGPFSPGNNCGGPVSPGGAAFNQQVAAALQQQNLNNNQNSLGQQQNSVGGGGGGGGGGGSTTPTNQQYPPNHPLSGSKHLCSICGDRASGKHYGVYRFVESPN